MTQYVAASDLRVGDVGRFDSSPIYQQDKVGDARQIVALRPASSGRFPLTVAVRLKDEAAWTVLPSEAIYAVESRAP